MADTDGGFEAFWLFYLRQHADPRTRAVHYAGTLTAVLGVVACILVGQLWFLIAVPVAGYGPGGLAHVLIERNRPAAFRHPLWSFLCDFRMTFGWVTGQIAAELARAGVSPPKR